MFALIGYNLLNILEQQIFAISYDKYILEMIFDNISVMLKDNKHYIIKPIQIYNLHKINNKYTILKNNNIDKNKLFYAFNKQIYKDNYINNNIVLLLINSKDDLNDIKSNKLLNNNLSSEIIKLDKYYENGLHSKS